MPKTNMIFSDLAGNHGPVPGIGVAGAEYLLGGGEITFHAQIDLQEGRSQARV